MKTLLGVLSVLAILVAVFFINSATMGVAIIGAACWLAIMSRIYQAEDHQKQLEGWINWLGKLQK